MQFRNFFLLLLTALFIFNYSLVAAQKVTTNSRGEKIVVYPDGSWRYFDEPETDTKPSTAAHENESDSGLPFEIMSRKPVKVIEDREAIVAAERALAEEKLAIEMEEDARYEREILEDQLEDGLAEDLLSKKQIKDLETRIKIARQREKEAVSKRKKASKAAKKAEMNVEKLTGTNDEDMMPPEPDSKRGTGKTPRQVSVMEKTEPEKTSGKAKKDVQKSFVAYNPDHDVMLNPPDPGCKLVFDGKDEFSGKNRKVVEKQAFFSHTPEKLRNFLKTKDYIHCDAYLSSLSGGYKFLTLEITIASERAQREYGIIEKGSVLTVKLLNGDNVKLFNNKTDVGKLNSLEKTVSYTAQYIISSGSEKMLRKNEVDKVRVIWSSGYEDYEVYELDFFIDQFKCLNNK